MVKSKKNSRDDEQDRSAMTEINDELHDAEDYVAKRSKDNNESVDSSYVPDMLTEITGNKHVKKSSCSGDYKEEEDKEGYEKKDKYEETDIFDAIIEFMKTDDCIVTKETEHREVVSVLKKKRTQLENYLIDYLEHIEQDCINLGTKVRLMKEEKVLLNKKQVNEEVTVKVPQVVDIKNNIKTIKKRRYDNINDIKKSIKISLSFRNLFNTTISWQNMTWFTLCFIRSL